jgi:hypothetical protein
VGLITCPKSVKVYNNSITLIKKDKMLNNDSQNQYTWIMKVLDSCQNDAQVGTTEKLFELYKKRWVSELTQKNVVTLTANFDKEKKSKLFNLRKKGKSFFSNMSQFFLF